MSDVSILSIDAWRYDGGWQWNEWWKVGTCPLETADLSPRKLLAYFRREGYLSPRSVGRCAIEDDGYNVVILERSDRRPLFAIEYGPAV